MVPKTGIWLSVFFYQKTAKPPPIGMMEVSISLTYQVLGAGFTITVNGTTINPAASVSKREGQAEPGLSHSSP